MKLPLSQLLQLRRQWIPYLILLLSLLVTFEITFYHTQSIHTRDQLRFQNAVQRTKDSIHDKFTTYIALLRGTSGLFAANDYISRKEFKDYVDRLQLKENYPGIQGLGFSKYLNDCELTTIQEIMQQEGFSDFQLQPKTARKEYHAILYLEPLEERNRAAIGFDMFSEPVRRQAMEMARNSAQPAMSGKVTLVQEIDKNKQAGFLIYVPVYTNGTFPQTLSAREEMLEGYVYSPFRADDLFKRIYGTETEPRIDFQVYDGTKTTETNLLFNSNVITGSKQATYKPRFTLTEQLKYAGRTWTLTYSTTPGFDRGSGANIIPYVFLIGIAGSFFLFYMSRLQYVARYKAELSENKLRQSEERFRRLVESTSVVPWEADAETGIFTYVGPQAKLLFGYPINDWYKNGFWESHIYHEDRKRTIDFCMTSLATKNEYEFDYRMLTKNNKILWIHDIVTVVRKPGGKKLLTGFFVDVTEREMLMKQKDDFVSIATHELKTPVTSIKAYAQLLQKQFEKIHDKNSADLVSKMDSQLDKLTHLIGDLLDVTKIESGQLQFRKEKFDMNNLVEEIIEELQRTTEKHKIIFTPDKLEPFFGDRERIGQVLTNLLSNAIKYSPRGKKILVSTKRNKSSLTVSVQDFGIGIPKESFKKVFQRFYRVNRPNTSTFSGLGLGLYITAEIIRRHNGKIIVESEKGKGSIFRFTLPTNNKRK